MQRKETVSHLTHNSEHVSGSNKVEPDFEPALVCKPQTTPTYHQHPLKTLPCRLQMICGVYTPSGFPTAKPWRFWQFGRLSMTQTLADFKGVQDGILCVTSNKQRLWRRLLRTAELFMGVLAEMVLVSNLIVKLPVFKNTLTALIVSTESGV